MGQIICISSGKGGVGKTVAAINIGTALAEMGKKVTLLDGSLTTPDVSLYLNIPLTVRTLNDVLSGRCELDKAVFEHKSGLKIIPSSVRMDFKNVFSTKKATEMLSALREANDFLIIDSPAGLGPDTRDAMKVSDHIIVVTNPDVVALVDSFKAVKTALDYNKNVAGIIMNKTGSYKGELKDGDVKVMMEGVPIIGKIPYHRIVFEAVKKSMPVLHHEPRSHVAHEFRKIAHHIAGEKYEKRGLLARIFGWGRKK